MAAPFNSYYIDVGPELALSVPAPVYPKKAALGKNLSVQLGYENIDELLPYDGIRGVVHRSTSAKTGMLVGRTEDDGFLPKEIGFESGLERATAISSLIHPNTRGLKCQPRNVVFAEKVGKVGSNCLDFLLILKTGQQIYLYVKNEDTLARDEQALIGQQIRLQLPQGCGFATISEEKFPPQLRGNNERIFLSKRFPDPDADMRLGEVLEDLIDVQRFTIEELVFRGAGSNATAEQGRIFDAVLRAIGDQKLDADKRRLIDYPTVVRRVQ